MNAETASDTTSLAVIGVDIGKEVFHLVGLGADGKIAFRRKIRRLALKDAFEQLPPCIVGMEARQRPLCQPDVAGTRSRAADHPGDLYQTVREGAEERPHDAEGVADEKSADLLVGWQPPLLSKAADCECVGPLPPELQDPEHSTWTSGAATKAADLGAAKGFTQELASPESLGVFKGKGFTPP